MSQTFPRVRQKKLARHFSTHLICVQAPSHVWKYRDNLVFNMQSFTSRLWGECKRHLCKFQCCPTAGSTRSALPLGKNATPWSWSNTHITCVHGAYLGKALHCDPHLECTSITKGSCHDALLPSNKEPLGQLSPGWICLQYRLCPLLQPTHVTASKASVGSSGSRSSLRRTSSGIAGARWVLNLPLSAMPRSLSGPLTSVKGSRLRRRSSRMKFMTFFSSLEKHFFATKSWKRTAPGTSPWPESMALNSGQPIDRGTHDGEEWFYSSAKAKNQQTSTCKK